MLMRDGPTERGPRPRISPRAATTCMHTPDGLHAEAVVGADTKKTKFLL